jgi:hypothetical protein
MAEPGWPPGQRSLFDLSVRRVAEKRQPPEVDQAVVERDLEAKRQARASGTLLPPQSGQ